jgi:hypothetical protein
VTPWRKFLARFVEDLRLAEWQQLAQRMRHVYLLVKPISLGARIQARANTEWMNDVEAIFSDGL